MAPAAPTRLLPDIAAESAALAARGRLDWVGMDAIEMPVLLADASGAPQRVAARVAAQVNLRRADARGIHMSRLYLHVDRVLGQGALSPALLHALLRDCLDSHRDLSDRARVGIAFEHLLRRPALVSDHSGWRAYPVTMEARLDGDGFRLDLGFTVLYSSTCPCSAALARQLIQDRFRVDFPAEAGAPDRDAVLAWLGSEQGICATPHSQRSAAEVTVRLAPQVDTLPIAALVDAVEQALATPVQTAVKREDEQAFAALNAANLQFCEDAARRVQARLDADARVADFRVRARHIESLHAHDAVAVASKGLPGGLRDADD